MKKYKILKDDRIFYTDKILYRIKALKDFGKVKKGDLGGYIEAERNLSQDGNCWISGNAKVLDNAYIFGDAKIYGNTVIKDFAFVYGKAALFDNVIVSGNAEVYEEAIVTDNAKITKNSTVRGNAGVYGNAEVSGFSKVYGSARISGNAKILRNAEIFENARVHGNAIISGCSLIHGRADISGNAIVTGKAEISNNALICGNARVYGSAKLSYGIFRGDIKRDLIKYIGCSLNIYPVRGKYILYKRVNKIEEGVYRSLYDPNFIYKKGKIIKVKHFDPNFLKGCSSGLHVSMPNYWSNGNTLIAVEVKVEDIITCMDGKLRVKKLKVLDEIKF